VAHAAGSPGLPDYPRESEFLVQTPGTTTSVAGGLFNPAAWALLPGSGLLAAWDDTLNAEGEADRLGVLSLHNLAFGLRRFTFRDSLAAVSHVTDYTLGFSTGARNGSLGVSYSWAGGRHDLHPRHERITVGSIHRPARFLSVGLAGTWDLERRDNFAEADLGIRPLGPRLTLFADAVYAYKQRFKDIRTGYGAEVIPIPGLSVSGKAQSTGEWSAAVTVSLLPGLRLGARPHFDDAGHQRVNTYSVELGPETPQLGYGLFGRGVRYPRLSLKGQTGYQRYGLFDDRRTLLGTLDRIDRASENPYVGGIVLYLSDVQMSPEMLWEIREQLAAFRASGKKVVVYADRLSFFQYMLASVADQIWLDPEGEIDVSGLATGRTFYRHALDKLGIGVDELRFFTYKSAAESFSRSSMSEADKRQRQDLIDDWYETITATCTQARGISRAAWEDLITRRVLVTAKEARAASLVDSIGSFDDAKHAARKAPLRTTPDLSHATLGGVMGNRLWGPLEWGQPNRIAVLYAIGPCDMDTGIRGRLLSQKIKAARKDRSVKAVVFRADSPGGDPLPSDLVSREILETAKKKPVIVSQGQVAGSGGYWISMFGSRILASPFTVTGSIGVIDVWLYNKRLGDKIGVTYDGVKRGEHADLVRGITLPLVGTIPDRDLTPEERARAEVLIRDAYGDFVAKVASGRKLPEARVDSIGQGHFYSGTRGLSIGLVDEIGGLWRSLQIAKAAAHLPAGQTIEVVEGPKLGALNPEAFQPKLLGAQRAPVAVDALGLDLLAPAEREFVRRVARAGGHPLVLMEPLGLEAMGGGW
jgi:protease-4